jgi:hypothetical protein
MRLDKRQEPEGTAPLPFPRAVCIDCQRVRAAPCGDPWPGRRWTEASCEDPWTNGDDVNSMNPMKGLVNRRREFPAVIGWRSMDVPRGEWKSADGEWRVPRGSRNVPSRE